MPLKHNFLPVTCIIVKEGNMSFEGLDNVSKTMAKIAMISPVTHLVPTEA